MFELIESVDVANTLGEGVTWDEQTQRVWWTDIEQCKLYVYDVVNGQLETYDMPYRLCAFALTAEPDTLLAAFDRGIALYPLGSGASHWLFEFPDSATVRFNDGRVDPAGRFWVGTVNEDGDRTSSSGLYCVTENCSVQRVEADVGICNGLAWNTDATRFYMSDSALQRIFCYDYECSTGAITSKRLFAETESTAAPDGAIMAEDDRLWSAFWGAASIVRLDPHGNQERFDLPVSQPTCVAFGGVDNDLLFVTSARYALDESVLANEPLAGCLLIYRTDSKGAPTSRFQGAKRHG